MIIELLLFIAVLLSMMDIKRLTRKELYEEVWSEPIVKLARKYGFSDVWLARICKKNNIPRPPRGYWARVQSGQRVPKTPLPKGDDKKIIAIITHDLTQTRERIIANRNRSSKKLLRSIVIQSNPAHPHPLVSGSARILESADPDTTGIVHPHHGCLDVHVSKDCLSRALNVMDSVIKSLTAMGFEVFISGNKTAVSKDGVSFSMSLYEEMDRRRRLKAADHNLEGYYRFGYNQYDKRAYPSGRLALSIVELGSDSLHKKTWRDAEIKNLEDHVKAIISSLIRMTAIRKALMINDQIEE